MWDSSDKFMVFSMLFALLGTTGPSNPMDFVFMGISLIYAIMAIVYTFKGD